MALGNIEILPYLLSVIAGNAHSPQYYPLTLRVRWYIVARRFDDTPGIKKLERGSQEHKRKTCDGRSARFRSGRLVLRPAPSPQRTGFKFLY